MSRAASGLRIYHYWRSSCSWRVRWGLELKGVKAELIPVSLLSGESESAAHLARNPLGYVPVLELPDGQYLSESIAILEWLEETLPGTPPLLPAQAMERARVRQLVQVINSDTQPLQNLSAAIFHSDDAAEQKRWNRHWNETGLAAFETLAARTAGRYAFGDTLTLADVCLIPQCYAALRNDVALEAYPTVARIYRECLELASCQAAHPDRFKPAD